MTLMIFATVGAMATSAVSLIVAPVVAVTALVGCCTMPLDVHSELDKVMDRDDDEWRQQYGDDTIEDWRRACTKEENSSEDDDDGLTDISEEDDDDDDRGGVDEEGGW